MTTKQIAELCGVDESTVLRWAKKASSKMPSIREKLEAAGHGTPALFALEEAVELSRVGKGDTFAELLIENAGRKMQADAGKMQSGALAVRPRYSAAFLREYRLTYGIEAAKELMAELGFAPKAPANQIPFPALPAPDPSFADLIAIAGEKGARQAVAVLLKVARAESDRKEADRKQGRLL